MSGVPSTIAERGLREGSAPAGRYGWRRSLSRTRRFIRRQPLGAFGLIILAFLAVIAVAAPFIAPYDPASTQFAAFESPGATNWFGTDDKGRDIFSRVIHGSRASISIAVVSTAMGVLAGTLVGLTCGYFRGWVDMVIQRAVDGLLAFPGLVLALVAIAVFGTSNRNLMLVIGFAIMPGISRVVRGTVLSEREAVYVDAARAMGASPFRIMFRHLLPNLLAPIIVVATSLLGSVVLIEAGLSFLGFGTQPPTPSWGANLSGEARRFFAHAPWMPIFPGVAVSLLVLAFNLLGDALRDEIDPRLRGSGGGSR